MGSYTSISADYGITFNDVTFLFKIDHDDGTVNTDHAMRKLDMNSIDEIPVVRSFLYSL